MIWWDFYYTEVLMKVNRRQKAHINWSLERKLVTQPFTKSEFSKKKMKNCWKNPCYSRSKTALFKELTPSKKPRYSNPRKSNPRYSRSPCNWKKAKKIFANWGLSSISMDFVYWATCIKTKLIKSQLLLIEWGCISSSTW